MPAEILRNLKNELAWLQKNHTNKKELISILEYKINVLETLLKAPDKLPDTTLIDIAFQGIPLHNHWVVDLATIKKVEGDNDCLMLEKSPDYADGYKLYNYSIPSRFLSYFGYKQKLDVDISSYVTKDSNNEDTLVIVTTLKRAVS